MNRILYCIAIALIAGCQHPAWQNPYAMIGPATVPPPSVQGEAAGYYPAVAETGTSRTAASTTIRSEIPAEGSAASSSATSFPAAAASDEPPIRIVEAAPAKLKTTTAPVKASPAPLREPPASLPPSSRIAPRRDSAVVPASYSADLPTFVETTIAAQGQWRVR